jgi:hypothetical protein
VQADIQRAAGGVPVLLLNTENFDSPVNKDNRHKFLAARARAAKGDEYSAVTELITMKVSHGLIMISGAKYH